MVLGDQPWMENKDRLKCRDPNHIYIYGIHLLTKNLLDNLMQKIPLVLNLISSQIMSYIPLQNANLLNYGYLTTPFLAKQSNYGTQNPSYLLKVLSHTHNLKSTWPLLHDTSELSGSYLLSTSSFTSCMMAFVDWANFQQKQTKWRADILFPSQTFIVKHPKKQKILQSLHRILDFFDVKILVVQNIYINQKTSQEMHHSRSHLLKKSI